MEPRMNNPRVFLSHSKADIAFIENLKSDLQRCQINTWLDSDDIRHGRPWLEAIFEYGIPTCDAVLVYFTEASIESKMVKKEMDAGIIHQLQDGKVAFLPYVIDEEVRRKLRPDIQALQTHIWNDSNYAELLPQVVAEIWRCFLERTVPHAVQAEQVKRLQAELSLETLKKESAHNVFSQAEETEFRYLWKTFDRIIPMRMIETVETENEGQKDKSSVSLEINVNFATVIALLIEVNNVEYSCQLLKWFLVDQAKSLFQPVKLSDNQKKSYAIKAFPDLVDELMMYGFLNRRYNPPKENKQPRLLLMSSGGHYTNMYTEKFHRFRYWLAYNNMLPNKVSLYIDK